MKPRRPSSSATPAEARRQGRHGEEAAKNTKTIILLSDPADEKQALAANEPAAPASKPAKTDK